MGFIEKIKWNFGRAEKTRNADKTLPKSKHTYS